MIANTDTDQSPSLTEAIMALDSLSEADKSELLLSMLSGREAVRAALARIAPSMPLDLIEAEIEIEASKSATL